MTIQEAAQLALNVQNACNLCGVAQTFAEVMKVILRETGSTEKANKHPVAVMFASKISSLSNADTAFITAYGECERLAGS